MAIRRRVRLRRNHLSPFTAKVITFGGLFLVVIIALLGLLSLRMPSHPVEPSHYIDKFIRDPSKLEDEPWIGLQEGIDRLGGNSGAALADSQDTDRDLGTPTPVAPITGPQQLEDVDTPSYGDMRVAVLIPYSGAGLPVWFDAFTELAAANEELVDWIIFCEQVRQGSCSSCVTNLSRSDYSMVACLVVFCFLPRSMLVHQACSNDWISPHRFESTGLLWMGWCEVG